MSWRKGQKQHERELHNKKGWYAAKRRKFKEIIVIEQF